jgi:hypothetical protein
MRLVVLDFFILGSSFPVPAAIKLGALVVFHFLLLDLLWISAGWLLRKKQRYPSPDHIDAV